ncbi:cryptochrome/photolyase family protein [Cypionkella psychrotolerans]|uniref:cryptochrome/photolyase family protein n=1 Tax=Cypionkella psychrotolerans TaxID=1678131 RepID=UPI0006B4F6B7|nr:FAD-binding domain-containing protein [Cypionkella psychrotolerans]
MADQPLILWFRRDFRLSDHPMLAAAVASGRPLLPVFVLDAQAEALGAAAKWRLGLGVARFAQTLAAMGQRLILRRGDALAVLQGLIAETGAAGVMWQRMYDPQAVARDTGVKAALKAKGLVAESFPGALLIEPWEVATGQGGYYKVYSPFWKAVSARGFSPPVPAVTAMRAPDIWPASEDLADWQMGAAMRRGAVVCLPHQRVGEAAALARLDEFIDSSVVRYKAARDFPGVIGATSGLSENLAWGEIGPRTIWAAGQRALHQGDAGAEQFCKELVWREFAYHLMHHSPHILTQSWREGWEDFPWRSDNRQAEAWRRGMTGEPFVDAAMREMYVSGRMHNRARMVVASYLTKHLLTDWRLGQAWFAECLTDWDEAANAMGWQWVAGSGPDAAPYFRVFNPAGQAEKFDSDGAYRRRWIAEISAKPGPEAQSYFAAVPRRWNLAVTQTYPDPIFSLADGRARALEAYAARGRAAGQTEKDGRE